MTDRISGHTGPIPLPRPRPTAAADLGAGATHAADALRLVVHTDVPAICDLPLPPVLKTGFTDLFHLFNHGFQVMDQGLHHLWDGFTHLLRKAAPYGLGVKLHVKDQQQYPSALSRFWLGQPTANGKLPVSTAELEREVQAELAKEHGNPGVSLGWKGYEPDAEGVRSFARETGRLLANGMVEASPEQKALIARQAVQITHRVLTPAQQARQTFYEGTTDPAARELADHAVQAVAEAARDAHVAVVLAYAHLPAAERARVEALRGKFEGSPRVQEALDGLVQTGRIGSKDLRGGKTTLDHLEALATAPLEPAIAAQRLETLGETIMEIAQPGSISQRGRNTCGAAAAQGNLAQESPAEYVRLLVGLASPNGHVETTTGKWLHRNKKWFLDEHTGDRSVPSRLLQSSFMEVSSNGSYDNKLDRGRWPALFDWVGNKLHLLDGSFPAGEAHLMHDLTGRDFYAEWNGSMETKGEGFEHASREHPVMALMNFNDKDGGESLHWVRVIGYDPAKDEYRVLNARARNQETDAGTEDVVGGADFVKHHVAIVREGKPPGSLLLA
ncbi:MAG: hypothetical protein JWM80_4733 [Cyanobacteria bacterium RYN_339]|nr:hypothetical protein [Cyanobacteria bacterium RYN_339]